MSSIREIALAKAIGGGGGGPSVTVEELNVTQNGTTTAPSGKAYSPVNVAVPNSYTAGDEGKVVSNGALIVQTAHAEVTENGTIDTTLNNSVVVSVSGGGAIDKSKQNSYLDGNCYIKKGRITGFSTGSSIWRPRNENNTALIVNWSQPFKIHARLTLNNTYGGSQTLYGASASGVYFVLPTCEIRPAAFWFGFTTDGSSWTNEITITTVPVVASGEYEIDVVYNGTKISVTVSDGTNTETAETTPSTSLYNNSNDKIGFGGIAQNSNLVARYVMFEPDDTYIESNGSIVWGAKTP